tara:strand:+ start:353 stop:730 length:378 start_codon:yes stop_codon:yes gene_type:complete
MNCKRCGAIMINNYEDRFCANCGYRDTVINDSLLLTVEVTKSFFKHYDLEKDSDLKRVSKWLKSCVGSRKVGKFLREKSITCIACYKYLPPTPSGRVPDHVPATWFAQKIIVLINLARQKKGHKV